MGALSAASGQPRFHTGALCSAGVGGWESRSSLISLGGASSGAARSAASSAFFSGLRSRRSFSACSRAHFAAVWGLLEALRSDRAVMNEQVLTALVRDDKAVSPVGVEPLHGSGCHR